LDAELKKIKFAIGIHNHQPIGNFEFVFEDSYRRAYLPFLEVLERHPKIKIALHYSGVLFEWILKHDPDFGPRLRKLVSTDQVEMMSGGFYEPILVNIPDEDKLGQIKKLNQFVKKHTGYHPVGLWLAERIWEPQLPKPLAESGAKYVVIDDSHFKAAGLEEKDLFGYYITEETGYIINIFPISERLRYTMPFQEPEITFDYLCSIATEQGDKLVVFADDGEKFGNWPGTYEHCYEKEWLERFFTILENNLDWIEIVHFSEALEKLEPAGRIYLPTASYREMMEWALPANTIERYETFENKLKENGLFEAYKVFVRGGFWRNFLAKYPESNNLHKKSLWVSRKVHQLKGKKKYDQKLVKRAQDHLWAGQTNCPYWHGIFGGLYLNNLRHTVYKNTIQAETIIDRAVKSNSAYKNGWIDVNTCDFNADGKDELIIETKVYNFYFSPQIGGTLYELDYKPKAINLLDTMTRRKEAYHNRILELKRKTSERKDSSVVSIHDLVVTKEPDLEKKLKYDWYNRTSLIDHFLGKNTNLEQIANAEHIEAGDFVQSPYFYKIKLKDNLLKIKLFRDGFVKSNGRNCKISITKTVIIYPQSSDIEIQYQIKNLETVAVDLWFAPEFNFALLAGDAPDRYYYFDQELNENKNLASMGIVESARKAGLRDEWQKIDVLVEFNKNVDVWRFPVETISQSEGGFERVYQSSVVLPNWKIRLVPSGVWTVKIHQKIIDL